MIIIVIEWWSKQIIESEWWKEQEGSQKSEKKR